MSVAGPPASGLAGSRRGRPPARNEILQGGRLGGCDPGALAAQYRTPLYVYDLDTITRQLAALHAALPPAFELAYAVKANPSLGVIAHLGGLGLGADVASAGELAAGRRAGVTPDRIVMTGPGKRNEELQAAIVAGIRAITVESVGELGRLARLAAAAALRVPVMLRAAVSAQARLERVRLVGDDGAGKFGMGADDLLEAARRAVCSPHLDLLGVHAFGASNVLDPSAVATHVETTIELGRRLAREVGFELRLVDVGGGLGIPYEAHEEPLDLVTLGRQLAVLADRLAADPATRGLRVLMEPGRFLVGSAGAYLTRVVDRKAVDGREVVILDGGIHHLLRPALTGQQHRVRRLGPTGTGSGRFVPVTVAGPLCSGLDVLATETMLQAPEVGDLVAVLDVGAYGYTESMPLFLSHPVPAEVAVSRGRASLLRPRIEPDSWLEVQRRPDW
ncbi:MAG TPA: alanine racemase [Vitreimonas sp.]|nr:alanine racemase [Vitreimonas sp.]